MALPVTIAGLSTVVAPVGPFKSSVIAPVASLTSGSTSTLWGADTSNEQRAQEIQAPTTGPLSSIRFKMGKTGAPTDNVWVEVRDSIGNTYPTGGTVLATSDSVLGSTFPSSASNDWITFTFPTQPTLLAGNKYVFTLCRTALNASNYYGISGDNASAYAAGVSWFKSSGAWSAAATTLDWNFRVYYADSVPQENYYFFGRDGTTATTLRAFISSNPSVGWNALSSAKTGFTTAILGLSAYIVGNVIHIAVMDGTSPTLLGIKYVSFDMETQTWLATTETISAAAATTAVGAAGAATSIVVRSTGEVVAFYSGVQTKTSGTFYSRVYYKRRTGVNTWSTAVQVDSNTANQHTEPFAALGANDRVHFQSLQGGSVALRTLSAANALSAITTTVSIGALADIANYDVGGVTKIVVSGASNGLGGAYYDSSDAPTMTIAYGTFNNGRDPHRLFIDESDVYHLCSESTSGDLFLFKSIDHGASWTQVGTGAVFTGTVAANKQALSFTFRTYSRGSAFVVPYVVNDGGTWKYNEHTVRVLTQVDAWNANDKTVGITLSASDKVATFTAGGQQAVRSTQLRANGSAGKYYAELRYGGSAVVDYVGVERASEGLTTPSEIIYVHGPTGIINVGASQVGSLGRAALTTDVTCIAWDTLTERAWFRFNNGLWNNNASADPAMGVGGVDASSMSAANFALYAFGVEDTGAAVTICTGFVDFQYQHPAGFTSWMGEIAQVDEAWHVGDKTAGVALSEGDKTATATSSIGGVRSTTRRSAGKYYAEFHLKAGSPALGLKDTASSLTAQSTQCVYVWPVDGSVFINGTSDPVGLGAFVANDILSVAWDDTAKLIWFRKNAGEWNPSRSGNPAAGTGGLDLSADITESPLAVWFGVNGTGNSATLRTEKDEFTQTTPGGYLSWMGETLVLLPVEGTGALVAQSAGLVSNFALSGSVGTGALVAADRVLASAGAGAWNASGALVAGQLRTNLVKWSEELDSAFAWERNAVTLTANVIAAPNATMTAERVSDSALNINHYLYQASIPIIIGRVYTHSIYLKAGTLTWAQVVVNHTNILWWGNFNLATGATGLKSHAGVTLSVTPLSDGWYRCSVTTLPATLANDGYVYLNLLQGDLDFPSSAYAGGTGNIYAWGCQLEFDGPTAYIPTTSAPVTVGAPPLLTGAGEVTTPPAIGTGALTSSVTALVSNGTVASVGTGGGLKPLAIGSELFVIYGFGRTAVERVAEHFLAIGPTITSIKVWLQKAVATTDGVQIKVYTTDVSHRPTTTQVGVTSNVIDGSLLSTSSPAPFEFFFDPPIPVTSGAEYAFVAERTGALDDLKVYQIVRQEAETYVPGYLHYYTGGAWADTTNRDIVCVINHTAAGGLVPSPPPGRANIILQSQALEVAPWGLSAAIISADAALAPDLTTTAERVADTAASGSHVFWQSVTNEAAVYTYSFYAKAGTLERVRLSIAGGAGSGRADFNLSTGEVTQITSLVSAGATAVGDGWWRCHVTRNPGAGTGAFYAWLLDAAGNSSYVGTGKDLYLWGAQLEKGDAPSGYLPTTTTPTSVPGQTLVGVGVSQVVATGALVAGAIRANFLVRSQEFDNAAWQKFNATVTANAVTAPDSTLTAETVTSTASLNQHEINLLTGVVQPAGTYTVSVYAKAGTGSFLQILDRGTAFANFDLSSGTLGFKNASIITAAIEPVGNGWYRCAATYTKTSQTIQPNFFILDADVNQGGAQSTGPLSIHLWGAQAEPGDKATAYIPTTSAPITIGVPVTLTAVGLSSSRSTSAALVPLPSSILASGQTASSGTGALTSVATLTGIGTGGLAIGTATLVAGTAQLAAVGESVFPPITGTGTLTSSVVDLDAFGTSESFGTAGGGAVINTGAGPGNASYLGTPSGQKYSQNVYSLGTQIKSVQLWLSQLGTSVVGNVSVKLYTVDGAHLPATLLATSNTLLPSTSLPASATLCTFIFDPPLATTNGAELSVVLETEFIAPGNANCVFGYLRSTSVYPNAQWRFFDGAWRSDYTTYDIPLLVDQTFAGGLKAATAALIGTGAAGSAATGVLACATATLAAAGVSESRSTSAALVPQNFIQVGTGVSGSVGTAPLQGQAATLAAVGGVPAVTGTGTLSAGLAALVAPGISGSTGTAALQVQTNFLRMGDGLSGSVGTAPLQGQTSTVAAVGGVPGAGGPGILSASLAVVAGVGLSRAHGTGTLTSAAATVVGAAVAGSAGTGALVVTTATGAGAGTSRSTGTAALLDQAAVVSSTGNSRWVATGALSAGSSVIVSSGLGRWVGTGTLPAGVAAVAGAGVSVSRETAAALQASLAFVSGFEGVVTISGTGTMPAQSATVTAPGTSRSLGTGALSDPASALAGVGLSRSVGLPASLISQAHVTSASGASSSLGTGAPVSLPASVSGLGSILAAPSGTGALSSGVSGVTGVGGVVSLSTGTGALGAQAATLFAPGKTGWTATGTLSCSVSVLTSTGTATWRATGALPAGVVTIAGSGLSVTTGTAPLAAGRANVVGAEGVVVISGAGELQAQSRVLAGVGRGISTGSGSLFVSDSVSLTAEGSVGSRGTGALVATRSDLDGSGAGLAQGAGALAAQAVTILTLGGVAQWVGSATLPAGIAALTGVGTLGTSGTGALVVSGRSVVAGQGASASSGSAPLSARPATIFGSAINETSGAGELVAADHEVSGVGAQVATGWAYLHAVRSELDGAGLSQATGTGEIAARKALLHGFAVQTAWGDGALTTTDAVIAATDVASGTGVLEATASDITGLGETGVPVFAPPPDPPGGYPGTAPWQRTMIAGPDTSRIAGPGPIPPPWWLGRAA